MHDRGFGAMAIVIDIEFGADGIRIDLPHQLADELHLAPATFMRGDLARQSDRIEQVLGQLQGLKARRRQAHQSLAQFLQHVHFALALGLAWAGIDVVVFVVLYACG
jgi:hypothetical protein